MYNMSLIKILRKWEKKILSKAMYRMYASITLGQMGIIILLGTCKMYFNN